MLLEASRSVLFVVDVQEKLMPAIADGTEAVSRIRILLEAARRLSVPVIATEQYPEGLGPTLPEVAQLLGNDAARFAKTSFSGMRDRRVREHMAGLFARERRQVALCGAETHVCVLQTALDLKAAGFTPHLVKDACGSRLEANRRSAVERARDAGIPALTTEMVVFEWLERADRPEFKPLHALLK